MSDKYECEHCGHLTKRILFDLELPSCSVMCDNALKEEYLAKDTDHATTNE